MSIAYVKDDLLGGFRPLNASDFAGGGAGGGAAVYTTSTFWRATAAFGNVRVNDALEKRILFVDGVQSSTTWVDETLGNQPCTVTPTEPPTAGANVESLSSTPSLESTQKQLLASSAEVVALLQQQREFASTLWVDKSGAEPVYYSRREIFNESDGTFTVVFYDMSGAQVAYQNILQPVAASGDVGAIADLMQVLAGDPVYPEGAVLTLLRIVTADGSVHQTWRDASGSSVPAPTNYEPVSENSSRWISLNSYLSDLKGAGATGVAQPTGGSGMFGWLSGVYKGLQDLIGCLPTSLGQGTKAQSLSVTLASDQDAIALKAGTAKVGQFAIDQTTDGATNLVNAKQGTAAALNDAWPVRVTDGTNTQPTLDSVSRAGFVTDRTGWVSESVTGRVRDNTKDLVFTYGDGTSETLYFTTAGDYAGKSARA